MSVVNARSTCAPNRLDIARQLFLEPPQTLLVQVGESREYRQILFQNRPLRYLVTNPFVTNLHDQQFCFAQAQMSRKSQKYGWD